ncbi:hypothetical protein [Sphingomonas parva]|uniref:hypothetical protein n=1 Tax=Sphingomonas parva TaxID=2555898 RepID=UPI001431C7AE|nr:hypothetical protein [Sphingomonas parva]
MRPVLPFLVRASARSHPLRAALAGGAIEQAAEWSESVRFFVHTWLGGVVFFTTFLG